MTDLVGRKVSVKVPATSANLGPGFDTLGMALSYYDELEVEAVAGSGAVVEVIGEGAGEVPTDETNLVVRSIAHVFEQVGQKLPGLKIKAHNIIPHGRGMGSSGAAVVSGVVAAQGLLEGVVEFSSAQLLQLATDLEGHPDNVAPSLFGGLTIAWEDEKGPHHKKLIVHRGVSPLELIPNFKMSTAIARALQPESVPHADAVFNVSRSALLVAALTQSPELLMAATEDRLHQDYRSEAMPEAGKVIELMRKNNHAAVVSGAGPSVLVLASDPAERMEAAQLAAKHFPQWRALVLAVDFKGATVIRHQ
ncbi:MAG: homoserine kinase [Actinobacteria bacterium]|jgi:homoserine kinase|uniref:Homoserine kinase n=1 Tax=freshwater metagenome TaxID=449393 RepID=A0A6J6H595_9ZZZZ|nr:homoserine kinase [Actinomycetota bacterium]MTA29337.1 homoserine kinase [Actinomycetota bacterium]